MSKTPASASVFLVSFQGASPVPCLVVDGSNGEPLRVPEVDAFVVDMRARGLSIEHQRAALTTLAYLHDFVMGTGGFDVVDHSQLAGILWSFLQARRQGFEVPDGSLCWAPVQFETAKRDAQHLLAFSEYCAEHFGHFPLVPAKNVAFDKSSRAYADIVARFRAGAPSFKLLAHLGGVASSASPTLALRERGVRKMSGPTSAISKEAVEALIESTESVAQKMVFIQAAFGGQRISEILHAWRCDVLPGSVRPMLFPDDAPSTVPLVVLAHPSQANYVGSLSDFKSDRAQHLSRKYAMTPRNLLEADSMESGWKGMDFDNPRLLISQVFWTDRSWALIYWDLFKKLRDEILPLADAARTSHPYLIVNDTLSRKEFGQPMKMANILKAFRRAVDRIKKDGHDIEGGIHGLRHFYKASLDRMGMPPEIIQRAMHHRYIGSQQSYGKSAAYLNGRMGLLDGETK